MSSKAIVVWDKNGPVVGAQVSLNGHIFADLTNADGYSLDKVNSYPAGSALVVIVANGKYGYVEPCTLGDMNQNICCGSPASGNDIPLPPVTFKNPASFKILNPYWLGNDCGIRLSYLPAIPGLTCPQDLFVGWLYHLYDKETRDRIRPDYAERFKHIALSWIDAFDAGLSPQEFLNICLEWNDTDVQVTVFLGAKGSGMDHNVQALIDFAMPFLNIAVGKIPAFVIPGWEESLWLTTEEIYAAIYALAPVCLACPGTIIYIHEQQGYMGFPLPDHDMASFWWPLQGLVHGILLQRRLNTDDDNFRSWLQDVLQRLDGQWNMPPDNGIDGRKLMGVGFELNYMDQFFSGASEASGNHLGDVAMSQSYNGLPVMGSCNGFT